MNFAVNFDRHLCRAKSTCKLYPRIKLFIIWQAGIKSSNLSLALEPEAAALFCKILPLEKQTTESGTNLSMLKPGTRYMVLDLGGDSHVLQYKIESVIRQKTISYFSNSSGFFFFINPKLFFVSFNVKCTKLCGKYWNRTFVYIQNQQTAYLFWIIRSLTIYRFYLQVYQTLTRC